jgi:pimeloyl-ACP methyl ester carboxylesterase
VRLLTICRAAPALSCWRLDGPWRQCPAVLEVDDASNGSSAPHARRHDGAGAGFMTTVEANGVTLGVEHFGEAAAPLILLAGGTTMLSWPDALCEALARGGRHVVRYDLRDSGASSIVDPEAPTYTLRDLAADAAALARELDDRPAHLAGIGVGGMVAQVAALDFADVFSALTLAGTRPVAPGPVDEDLPDHDAATMERLFSRPIPDWSDRAAVAEFVTGGAEILGDDPVAARTTAERTWTARPARSPRCRWPTSWAWCSPSSTASRAGASACPSSRCRRSWCTVAATRSSQSATAKHSHARSPVRGCSCSNGPRPRSPMRSPVKSPRQ